MPAKTAVPIKLIYSQEWLAKRKAGIESGCGRVHIYHLSQGYEGDQEEAGNWFLACGRCPQRPRPDLFRPPNVSPAPWFRVNKQLLFVSLFCPSMNNSFFYTLLLFH